MFCTLPKRWTPKPSVLAGVEQAISVAAQQELPNRYWYIGADVSSPPFDQVAEMYGGAGFRANALAEVGPAVEAALVCGKPAVVDVAVDPAALYSFRRDSFKHRGG